MQDNYTMVYSQINTTKLIPPDFVPLTHYDFYMSFQTEDTILTFDIWNVFEEDYGEFGKNFK